MHAPHRQLAPLAELARVLMINHNEGAMPRRAHLTDLEITAPLRSHDALAAFTGASDED